MPTLHSSITAAAHYEALTAARAVVPHGWLRQANPHRLGPAFKAAGDAAREQLTRAGIGDGEASADIETLLTRMAAFVHNNGDILSRRKDALALSSALTNTLTRHSANNPED
jgi:hypothetical protein